MKKIYLILIFAFSILFSNAQQKKEIVFLFEDGKDALIENTNEYIYAINREHHFRYRKKDDKKTIVNYASIKNNIFTYETFLKLNKGKKFPDFFSEYTFLIYQKKNESSGFLIEVEKIWLVEEKIID
ncbi:hypothetical protein C8N46_10289 [Kordia periserrulae]|uniref:Intein n=1 Tax=Kordia periserrulae TaxID=701523 RepID=A0A2T6C327_9FLAO|nr:hypothetical protein [Kordia periserrulae]PTX62693.1 hypothetical protein C8N46_10289 [Kordia periserrulae]